MLRLLELALGIVLVYFGLSRFSRAKQARGVLYGLVAIVGLVLVIHGILLYIVPDFFKPVSW